MSSLNAIYLGFACPANQLIAPTTRTPRKVPSEYPRCSHNHQKQSRNVSRRQFTNLLLSTVSLSALGTVSNPRSANAARPEGVNRPELLPSEFTTVIDLERFLATGEVRRLREKIDDVEKRTGYKIRILTQRFPQTPGLAVRDYWSVDDNTIVCVADFFGGTGQLLKFNVGVNVDRLLPPRFWSILSANYGNKFYVSKNGEAASIINAVDSIRYCLLQNGCATPPKDAQSVIF